MEETIAILSGGLARRLRPITENIPKSMLEFGEKPFIQCQIELLKKNGFKNILICLGYLGEKIENFLRDGRQYGVQIKYSYDGEILLGTGGAILKAKKYLSDVFFVLYGDSYLDIDYRKIRNFFYENNKKNNYLGLMTVFKNNDLYDRSNVVYNNNMVNLYDKKNVTPDMDHIDYGLSILKKESLDLIGPENCFYDLADLLNDLSRRNQLLGYEVKKRFYEIGSKDGIKDFNDHIKKKRGVYHDG
jgi:N-acetyl-alpha-D-muramate 1-phosphate uridylyltransferase